MFYKNLEIEMYKLRLYTEDLLDASKEIHIEVKVGKNRTEL